jgi:hypothetical protein
MGVTHGIKTDKCIHYPVFPYFVLFGKGAPLICGGSWGSVGRFTAHTIMTEQQLKKLGIIIHYLDKFNHNRSLHTPRAPGQTALQSEPLERASLLPGLSPGYIWHVHAQEQGNEQNEQ